MKDRAFSFEMIRDGKALHHAATVLARCEHEARRFAEDSPKLIEGESIGKLLEVDGHPVFTPGPWEVDSGMVQTVREHEHEGCKVRGGCGVHIPIAYMDRKPDNDTTPCERDSNAHLIATAPELLAACELALRFVESDWDTPTMDETATALLAVITKARR